MAPRAVIFDVGETLVDESRAWGEAADGLGVSRPVLFAVLGATIERRRHHRRVFGELGAAAVPPLRSVESLAELPATLASLP